MNKSNILNHAMVFSLCGNESNVEEIKIEVKIFNGLYNFTILGLADNQSKECKARIKAAIRSSNFKFPNKNVMVAIYHEKEIPDSKILDLPIILAILMASQQIKNFKNFIALGEVELSGLLRSNNKLIDYICASPNIEAKLYLCPFENDLISKKIDKEIYLKSLTKNIMENSENNSFFSRLFNIYSVDQLKDLDDMLSENSKIQEKINEWNKKIEINRQDVDIRDNISNKTTIHLNYEEHNIYKELIDIDSQKILEDNLRFFIDSNIAIRAIKISLSGYHSLCMIGDVGCGKTMLAKLTKYINHLLIKRELNEANSDSEIRYIISKLPFIEINKKMTLAQIKGGKKIGKSIFEKARNGIIFCDELLELNNSIILNLKDKLSSVDYENSYFNKDNAWYRNYQLDADFINTNKDQHSIFISTANPCKCGRLLDYHTKCSCDDYRIRQMWGKLSIAFIDRIEMWNIMQAINKKDMQRSVESNTLDINGLINDIYNARKLAKIRAKKFKLSTELNSQLSNHDLYKTFSSKQEIINSAIELAEFYKLSIRSFHNLLKLSLSISDINNKEECDINDFYEAITYRLDNNFLQKVGLL